MVSIHFVISCSFDLKLPTSLSLPSPLLHEMPYKRLVMFCCSSRCSGTTASLSIWRSHPVFTPNSDEASHEDDVKWDGGGKDSEGSNASSDIRLADNDAQIWRDQALGEANITMTSKPHESARNQIIRDEADDTEGNIHDEKISLDHRTAGGNVNYLRYSMCRST